MKEKETYTEKDFKHDLEHYCIAKHLGHFKLAGIHEQRISQALFGNIFNLKTVEHYQKELILSIEGRIKFYKENNRPDNASTLEILLNDIKNNQLLDFMKKDA